jgi:hypothetical protein
MPYGVRICAKCGREYRPTGRTQVRVCVVCGRTGRIKEGAKVHPLCVGFAEREIRTGSGGLLLFCWEFQHCGGRVRDIVEFLRGQTKRLNHRVTAIIRTKQSTWILDACQTNVRITHFRKWWTRKELAIEEMGRDEIERGGGV